MPKFCAACNASNPSASSHCGACGGALGEGAAPPASGRRPRFRHQLASGRQALNRVRMTFLVVGLLALAWTGLVALAMAGTDAEIEPEAYGGLLVNLCVGGAVAVTAALGVWRAQHSPLPWAIGAAGLLTLAAVVPLMEGRVPGVAQIVITLSAWGLVMPILRLGRLAAENPDRDDLRDLAPAPGTRHQARIRSKMRGVRRDFLTAAIVFVVFVASLFGLMIVRGTFLRVAREVEAAAGEGLPTQPIDAVLARFEKAWGNSDPKAIEPLFARRLQHKASRIGPTLERRGFKAPYPALRERRLGAEEGARRTVTFTTDVCEVKVVFEWADGAWGIGNFIFS